MLPNLQFLLGNVPDNSTEVTLFIILFTTFLLVTVLLYRSGWFEDHKPDFTPHTPMTAMEKVHNPFVVAINQPQESSIESRTDVSLTSQIPCCVRWYWGMIIEDIYPMIHHGWSQMHRALQDNTFKHFSLQNDERTFDGPVTNQTVRIKPTDDTLVAQLGDPPRDRYPLVMIVCDQEVLRSSEEETPPSNQVIMSITMFHIKDSVCSGPSHIIAQYVRTAHGRPCNLLKVYLSTEEPGSSPSPDSDQSHDQTASQSETTTQCVICLTTPVERVFLPCRHACVCQQCCSRLGHCPMCRTIISSSFVINTTAS